jgi:hypothetical protein
VIFGVDFDVTFLFFSWALVTISSWWVRRELNSASNLPVDLRDWPATLPPIDSSVKHFKFKTSNQTTYFISEQGRPSPGFSAIDPQSCKFCTLNFDLRYFLGSRGSLGFKRFRNRIKSNSTKEFEEFIYTLENGPHGLSPEQGCHRVPYQFRSQ